MKRLAIIIPVRQSLVKKDCFIRLYYNCRSLHKQGILDVVVVDGTKNFFLRKIIERIVASFGYTYISLSQDSYYTPAVLKNYAAQYVINILKRNYFCFLDVDVILSEGSIEYLDLQIHKKTQFDWLPVVFLRKGIHFSNIVYDKLLCTENIVQVGYTTGIQLFQTKFFLEIHGYDEDFVGYGCEDIEMLHRATKIIGMRNYVNADYYVDKRSHNIDELHGYRKYFYEYKKDFKLSAMPLHIWHKRQNKSRYLRSRILNDKVLLQKMMEFDNSHSV